MDSFTFVTLSYNQQDYIIEHLESIKRIVKCYASKISIDFILADDASNDQTVRIAKEWLYSNDGLFRNSSVLENSKNLGVVRNFLNALNCVQTEHFKYLAADDKFLCADIFSLYDDIGNNLIITPITPFGNINSKAIKYFKKNFCLIRSTKSSAKMRSLLQYENFLPTPGVFIPGEFFHDPNFREFLLQFHNVEDYPMFCYFLDEYKCGIKVLDTCYVAYRVGTGISTNKQNEKRKAYEKELRILHKIINVNPYKYPIYINPYNYYFKIVKELSWLRYKKKYS